MYRAHFGLREVPFSLTPDTEFYYPHAGHHEALTTVMVALQGGEGFVKISGEVGTGKTLLCRKLLNGLDAGQTLTAYLPNPCLTPAALRMAVAEELGIRYPRNQGQHRLLQCLHAGLIEIHAGGRRVVLLLDEAQALPDDTLEALRLLTNLETEKTKLLQVVLFGQPELDARLARPGLRQLRQRITFGHRLQGFDAAAVDGYLQHRLRVAGHADGSLFTPVASQALQRASGGIPRLLNILAHKALMSAFGRGLAQVDRRAVAAACADTEGLPCARRGPLARLRSRFALRGAAPLPGGAV